MTNPAVPPTAPVTPPPGGMPKWLIIVIIVLIVVVLGCCGGLTTCYFFAKRAATSVGGAMQNFTQEQLKKQGAEVDFSGTGLSLPDNFPGGVPIYSGFKIYSKVLPPDQPGSGTVVFKGAAAPETVGIYYESEMAKNGWSQEQLSTDHLMQQYSKDATTITFNITGGGGQTMLLVTYEPKK